MSRRRLNIRQTMRNRPLLVAYVIFGIGFGSALYLVWHQSAVEDFKRCEQSIDSRTVLRDVVIEATASGPLNLTGIPSFQQLDPETQQYLRDLEALSQTAPGDETQRDRLLRLIPIPTCNEPGLFG